MVANEKLSFETIAYGCKAVTIDDIKLTFDNNDLFMNFAPKKGRVPGSWILFRVPYKWK